MPDKGYDNEAKTEEYIWSISQIHEESEYECFRISLSAQLENTRIPLKVDITTGDVITPKEVRYSFTLLLENRSIDIFAYNLETVLAGKMETIISRGVLNTRMRDFYDPHEIKGIWGNYRKKFGYATDLEWDEVVVSLRNIFTSIILNGEEIK